MCDDKDFDEMWTRRQLNATGLGAGAALLLPAAAAAAGKTLKVVESEIKIPTPDGTADAYFVHPATGRHPAVIVWPDIFGLRPAFRQMGKRLAESGYAVLVPNPFYRVKPAPTSQPRADLQNETTRKEIFALAGSLSSRTHLTDAKAFIEYLDAQPAVNKKRKMGTTGYCMGGPITMRTAGGFPNRIGAAASFHGGGLVTDKPDSPHLYVRQMKASYLIAIADNDDQRAPKDKDVLRETFAAAGLPAEIEVYKGAQHGWCPPDAAVYNEAQAEKAWGRLLAIFDKALRS
jgi:carboxymethylenebutenolidase